MAQATPEAEPLGRRTLSPVVIVGLLMVTAHAALRAWAQYGSWFYGDDYRLLLDAHDRPLSFSYLLEPFDSQFMPVGRLLAWLTAAAGPLDWAVAASIVLALQVGAALACLRMLLVLFGVRWQVVALLALYLTSAIPLTAFMWWAAALNAIPMHLAFFLAVTEWVLYLRTRRPTRLLTTLLAVTLGLLSYVKALLILLVLAWLVLAYFTEGGPIRRSGSALRRYWPAAVLAGTAAVAYVVHYFWRVPQAFETGGNTPLSLLADAMIGRAYATAAWGGPWGWLQTDSPNALANPAEAAVRLVWVLIAITVLYSLLRRRNTGRAWLLLAVYLLALFVLLASSRGQVFSEEIALQYRYLADAAVATVLVLGLVFLRMDGAVASSTPRPLPLLTAPVPRTASVALVLAVAFGGLFSTIRYVGHWHDDDRKDYILTLTEGLRRVPNPVVADAAVPVDVVPPLLAPDNRLSRLTTLTGKDARFLASGHRVHVVGRDGTLREADVDPVMDSGPGPDEECGWRVQDETVEIPLGGASILPGEWWIRIGYLASEDTPLHVSFGGTTIETSAQRGLHQLYVEVPEVTDTVTLHELNPFVTLCVDRVETGPLEPRTGETP